MSKPPCSCSPANSILQSLIEQFYKNVASSGNVANGLAVGVINGIGQSGPNMTTCYSGYAVADQTLVTEDTVFEIGSVTKTFTTTMVANAVNQGQIGWVHTAESYLSSQKQNVTMPVYTAPDGKTVPITILDLADFTSGIGRKDPNNRAGPNQYTLELMYEYLTGLAQTGLPWEPGTKFIYVNVNFGILAQIVMLQAGAGSYAELLTNLISGAGLTMPNTGVIDSNSPSISGLAQGYLADGTAEPDYALPTWPALLGAGGIYSTLNDMLSWLQFNLGLISSSSYNILLPVLHAVQFQAAGAKIGEGLGWFIEELKITPVVGKSRKVTMIYKDGGTSGFHSWIGFIPSLNIGTVLLCNGALKGDPETGAKSPVDELGETILTVLADVSE